MIEGSKFKDQGVQCSTADYIACEEGFYPSPSQQQWNILPHTPVSRFGSTSVRLGFIRKVYGILSVQLAVTAGIVLLFLYNEHLRNYAYHNPGLLWLAVM